MPELTGVDVFQCWCTKCDAVFLTAVPYELDLLAPKLFEDVMSFVHNYHYITEHHDGDPDGYQPGDAQILQFNSENN